MIDHLTFEYRPRFGLLACSRIMICDRPADPDAGGHCPGLMLCSNKMSKHLYDQIKEDKFKWASQNLLSENNMLRELAHDIIYCRLEIL